MAAGAADNFFLRGVFEGTICGNNMEIQRRPYHRNCGCALHNGRGGGRCPHSTNNVSYPVRRSKSEGSLAMAAVSSGSGSFSSSPMSPTTTNNTSTGMGMRKGSRVRLEVYDQDD